MVNSIYFTSGHIGTGKTSLAIAAALQLKEKGFNVGYFKPLGWRLQAHGAQGVQEDQDAIFFKELLGMKEDYTIIQPVTTGMEFMDAAVNQRSEFQDKILNAFVELSKIYDYLVIEGIQGISFLEFMKLSAPRLAAMFGSDLVLIEQADLARTLDNVIRDKKYAQDLGANVTGLIVNSAPPFALETLQGRFTELLKAYTIKVWGIIPKQAKSQLAPTAGEIAKWLNGEVLVEAGLDRQVTDLSVGAMTPEQALRYFRRRTNKAVVTGGDRSDICLAALETDTSCLILTGNIYPSVLVLSKAEDSQVPIILVTHDTLTTVRMYEDAVTKKTLHPRSAEQANQLTSYLNNYVDFEGLLALSE